MSKNKNQNNANKELKEVGDGLIKEINKGKSPTLEFGVRALSNITFDKKEQMLKLGKKQQQRTFFNFGHAKKFLQTLEIAKVSKNLLNVDKHASLRDVFYMAKRTIPKSKINIVDEQSESDKALEDLELITSCSRELLNINANKMGSVAGNVIIEDSGDTINWAKLGSGGWSIPSNVEDIKFKSVKAKYIIYMEKQAVWERLHEDKFWKKQNCIIVTSQGQTTRGIRRLLQRLVTQFKLPLYVLADQDPWGFYIFSVLKYGSINLAHMSDTMTLPKAKFLGITADDIENYSLQKHFIKFKDVDMTRLKQIQDYDWFKDNKDWQKEFKKMKQNKAKVEIQALSSRGITFISDTYLPEKIKKKDWID
tara:strand:+ start:5123 stop:6217 length:1095 start_codon:yes stop_codon:yes gene_type:complete